MESLYDYIYDIDEGILDVDLDDQIEKRMFVEFIEKTFTGKFKIIKNKQGNLKIKGTMILRGFTGEEIPGGFYINTLDGNMYIENCPNLKSIGNLFGELRYDNISLGQIKGTLSIADCRNFNTLKGIPSSVEHLILTDLPKLKSIEFLPKFASSVMITKCGKKWTKEQIAAKSEFATIACSWEEHNEIITESMSEPILLRAHKYLIDNKIKFVSWDKMVGSIVEIDKIRPSQVTHFKMPTDKNACKKSINAMQRNRTGFALGFKDDKLIFLANSGRYIFQIESVHWKNPDEYEFRDFYYKPSEFLYQIFDKLCYDGSNSVTDIYVYDISETNKRHQKIHDRSKSKSGMITREDYQEIARKNKERYIKALAQLRSIKSSSEYIQLAQQIENRIVAYSKLIQKIVKNPEQADTLSLSFLTDNINELTNNFASFVRCLKNHVMGNASAFDMNMLKNRINDCKKNINDIDRRLPQVI